MIIFGYQRYNVQEMKIHYLDVYIHLLEFIIAMIKDVLLYIVVQVDLSCHLHYRIVLMVYSL